MRMAYPSWLLVIRFSWIYFNVGCEWNFIDKEAADDWVMEDQKKRQHTCGFTANTDEELTIYQSLVFTG